jgi:hypothetical protein
MRIDFFWRDFFTPRVISRSGLFHAMGAGEQGNGSRKARKGAKIGSRKSERMVHAKRTTEQRLVHANQKEWFPRSAQWNKVSFTQSSQQSKEFILQYPYEVNVKCVQKIKRNPGFLIAGFFYNYRRG